MIITNQLSKNIIFEVLSNLKADTVTWVFIKSVYRFYELSNIIIINKETQFTDHLWKWITQLLRITCKLLTVFYLEIDDFMKHINVMLKEYLRFFINYLQDNWSFLLSFTKLVIRNHDAAFTDISSFFLMHDYHLNSLNSVLTEDSHSVNNSHTLIQCVEIMMIKLQNVSEFIQIIMTAV